MRYYISKNVFSFLLLILVLLITTVLCTGTTESPTINENPLNVQEGDTLEFYLCTVKPAVLVKVSPIYPDSAKAAGIEGLVVIAGLIGIDGSVEGYKIIKSIPALDQAAIDALLQFKFKPAEYYGILVKVWMTIPFTFRL